MSRRSTLWTLGFVLVAALATAPPTAALELSGSGVLTGPVFLPEPDDEVLVFVANTGRRALAVEVVLLRADDHSLVATSGPKTVAPRTTETTTFIPSDFPVLVVVRYRANGRTSARVSLQVLGADGQTRIFTDGFESGDTS